MNCRKMMFVLCVIACVFTACGKKTEESKVGSVTVNQYVTVGNNTYMEEGAFIYNSNYLFYFDAETGKTSITCMEPTCNHVVKQGDMFTRESDCLAWYNDYDLDGVVFDKGKMYYISDVVGEGNGPMKSYWCADPDGSNRKRLAVFSCPSVTCVKYTDDYVFVAAEVLWDYEKNQPMEHAACQVIKVDRENYNSKVVFEMAVEDDDWPSIEGMCVHDNNLLIEWENHVYAINMNSDSMKEIEDLRDIRLYEAIGMFEDKFVYHRIDMEQNRYRFYYYNLNKGEEKEILLQDFDELNMFSYSLVCDKLIFAGVKGQEKGIYSCELETGKVKLIHELESNIQEFHITAVVGESVYFGEILAEISYLSAEDFLKGHWGNKATIIEYENQILDVEETQ